MPELDIDHVPSLKLSKPLKKPTKQIRKQVATIKTPQTTRKLFSRQHIWKQYQVKHSDNSGRFKSVC